MAVKRLSARIEGRVQGVGFRYYTRDIAKELGLTGWVRNTWDGDVEVMAEGEEGRLARFIGMLREGPPRADVTNIDFKWEEPANEYDRFYVST
ncbi:MAG: acylphosphatase [Armatimonadota bacterium]